MIETIGYVLVIGGSIISIVGSLVNNLQHKHREAMMWWMVSNPLLCAWAIGNVAGVWNGGISVSALAAMYGLYAITNLYGLTHKNV